jgi:predicted transcriptional regulator
MTLALGGSEKGLIAFPFLLLRSPWSPCPCTLQWVVMLKVNRRSKVELYREVLDLFCQEGAESGKARLTRVARRANMPYDRFQKLVSCLIESKLILRTNTGVLITADGLCCLRKMQHANDFLREMGLRF